MTAEKLLSQAKQLQDTILKERRTLHQNPEVGFDIKNTVSFVKKELTDIGIEAVDCGKAGIIALIGKKNPEKTFLLRADMDALPIKEK